MLSAGLIYYFSITKSENQTGFVVHFFQASARFVISTTCWSSVVVEL